MATLFNRQSAGETALPESQFNFVANQTYYFTLTNDWLIFAVSNQKGESESNRTKPLKAGNISVQQSGMNSTESFRRTRCVVIGRVSRRKFGCFQLRFFR